MPKDKLEKVEAPKKKMVVVEEVPTDVSPVEKAAEIPEVKSEEVKPAETLVSEIPVVAEEKTAPSEPKTKEIVEKTEDEETEKSNYLWIIIPTALLVGALVGGLITYFSGISKLGTETPTPSPVATDAPVTEVTPTATPQSTIKREDLKVQILNGSGISGEAGKAKTLLEGLGYKNVDTGNASSSDFAETEIAIKAASADALATVVKDLSSKYSAVEADKPLATTSKYDLVITIGKK